MLEYFTYKKVKKHHQDKEDKKYQETESGHAPAPVLTPKDEEFLQRLTSEDGTASGQELALANNNESGPASQDRSVPDASTSRSPDTKGKGKWSNPTSLLPGFLSKKDHKKADKGKADADGTVTPNESLFPIQSR
jgi:hypothetical protein